MIGVFTGKDGSMGFRHGKEYKFNTFIRDNKLYIKTTEGLWCPYCNLEAMLENWRLLNQTNQVRNVRDCGSCNHLISCNLELTKQCEYESRW